MDTADAVQGVAEPVPQSRPFQLRRFLTGSLVPRVVLIVGAVLFMAPIYWMVVSALKTPVELTKSPPTLLPEQFLWQNFVDAVNYIPFFTFALNSTIITLG